MVGSSESMASTKPRPRLRRTRRNPDQSHNEGLAYLLLPVSKTAQIGPEKGRASKNGIGLFRSTIPGPMVSWRYVYVVRGSIRSALQIIVSSTGLARIANVFTAPGDRRRGYASQLLARAERDLGPVEHSEDLSGAGAAWRLAVSRSRPNTRGNPSRVTIEPAALTALGRRGLDLPDLLSITEKKALHRALLLGADHRVVMARDGRHGDGVVMLLDFHMARADFNPETERVAQRILRSLGHAGWHFYERDLIASRFVPIGRNLPPAHAGR